jgi:hypothetical protein
MSLAITRHRVRAKIDVARFNAPVAVGNNTVIQFWKGSPVQFEFRFDYSDVLITDLTNLDDLTLQIKTLASGSDAPAENATVLASKTITTFDDTLTTETWNDATKAHATIALTGAEANLTAGDAWIILAATITGIADPVTLAAGKIKIVADGYDSGAGAAPTPSASYLNTEQSDARYPRRGTSAAELLLDITALTGGASTALDGIATASLAAPYLVDIIISGGRKSYILQTGTDAEAAPGIIRPDDYHASTNAKVWKQVL